MSEDQKKLLEQQLWNVANTLRGKMNADEYRDYILGFIFYKYLSEKMELFANSILKADKLLYQNIDAATAAGSKYIAAIKEEAVETLGYFLKPAELFGQVAQRGSTQEDKDEKENTDAESNRHFILEDLQKMFV